MIAKSKEPFEVKTLKRFLKMDPDHKVLIQHPDGKIVFANNEVWFLVMKEIHSLRQKYAKVIALGRSNSDSGPATSESPRQAEDASGEDDEAKKLS